MNAETATATPTQSYRNSGKTRRAEKAARTHHTNFSNAGQGTLPKFGEDGRPSGNRPANRKERRAVYGGAENALRRRLRFMDSILGEPQTNQAKASGVVLGAAL